MNMKVDKQMTLEGLTPQEKKKRLFLKQKETLDLFRERNVIDQMQYDKSLGDLRDKMGMYDVEFGKRGNMSDFSYTIGAEYGYTFPISPRVSLDLAMALGYFGGTYKVYDPIDTHYVWQENRNRRYFGPVKADITLAFQIGKNYRTEKGGMK